MTQVSGKLLRTADKRSELLRPEPINGPGVALKLRVVKIFKPTGAPVHFFDVLDDSQEKVGHACLVLEPDVSALPLTGHLSLNLRRSNLNAQAFIKVAAPLISYAFERGVAKLRIVIPVEKTLRIKTAASLMPSRISVDVSGPGKVLLLFDFDKEDWQNRGSAVATQCC